MRTDADGRTWIDDIPLDVWYDDPLLVFSSNSQATPANGPAAPFATGAGQPMPRPAAGETPAASAPADPPAAGQPSVDWQELISAEVLDAEAKALRNQLTAALQTVATYNNGFQAIQWDGATLCALAGVAIEHPEPLSWKDKAPYVRDLAQKIEEAAQERGRTAFQETQAPFEQLVSVFSGNVPAGIEPPEATVPFVESASRGGLMRRMQAAQDWLTKNINSADRLTSSEHKDRILHEASVLAALTKVISAEGYDAADEPDYAREADEIVKHSVNARSAAQAGSYDAFRDAVDRIGTHCNNCHTNFRD
ncbi:MAG TPA: hypothetical protein VML55_07060 [Planctomycetaceae bacterium]|nr:hypothetical protein [Planctomycetaceae bacterium]